MAGTPPPRWRRRKDARPREILDAALAVFAGRGFAAASMEQVAARAGISKGTLYLYFPSKEDLFKAVVRAAIVTALEAAEEDAAHDGGPAMAVLERLLTGIAARVVSGPAGVIPKLMIAESGNFPELARFYRDEVIRRGLGLAARVIRRGVARGEFRPVDPAATAPLVVAPLLMAALWRHSFAALDGGAEAPSGDGGMDAQTLMRTHLDLLRHAFAPVGSDGTGSEGTGGDGKGGVS